MRKVMSPALNLASGAFRERASERASRLFTTVNKLTVQIVTHLLERFAPLSWLLVGYSTVAYQYCPTVL